MGMFFFLTQFLQEVLHYSALVAGLAFLPLTAVAAVGEFVTLSMTAAEATSKWETEQAA